MCTLLYSPRPLTPLTLYFYHPGVESEPSQTGLLIGAIIGAILAVIFLIFICVCCCYVFGYVRLDEFFFRTLSFLSTHDSVRGDKMTDKCINYKWNFVQKQMFKLVKYIILHIFKLIYITMFYILSIYIIRLQIHRRTHVHKRTYLQVWCVYIWIIYLISGLCCFIFSYIWRTISVLL
jgi:hypothetical protein